MHFLKIALTPFLLAAAPAPVLASFDADGVPIGAGEKDIKQRYPAAYCKKLEWESAAADRRCDDAKVRFAGIEARITFYLRKGAVEAFDVRFAPRDTPQLVKALKTRYGKPFSEEREPGPEGKAPAHKVLWEAKGLRALLVSVPERRRASLLVSRGDFEDEIYRVR